jgi:hypothetical protein
VRPPISPSTRALLHRARVTGSRVAVIYIGADAQAHYWEGLVAAIQSNHFVLDYLDHTGTPRRAGFDLANPEDVLAVEPVR